MSEKKHWWTWVISFLGGAAASIAAFFCFRKRSGDIKRGFDQVANELDQSKRINGEAATTLGRARERNDELKLATEELKRELDESAKIVDRIKEER